MTRNFKNAPNLNIIISQTNIKVQVYYRNNIAIADIQVIVKDINYNCYFTILYFTIRTTLHNMSENIPFIHLEKRQSQNDSQEAIQIISESEGEIKVQEQRQESVTTTQLKTEQQNSAQKQLSKTEESKHQQHHVSPKAQSKPLLPSLFKKMKVHCPYKNEAIFVCTQGCPIEAMICNEKQCRCQSVHKNCHITKISNLQNNIDQTYRIYDDSNKKKMIQSINSTSEKLIADVEKMQKQITEKVNYLGLQAKQVQFLEIWNQYFPKSIFSSAKTNKLQNSQGKFYKEVDSCKFADRNGLIKTTVNNMKNCLISFTKDVNKKCQSMKKEFQKSLDNYNPKFFINSSIIGSKNQEEKLMKMLPKFTSIEKVSKWSENTPTQNYWNNAVKPDTIYRNVLILVKNSYKKVFGAFINCTLSHNQSIFNPQNNIRKLLKYDSQKQQQFLFSLNQESKVKSIQQIDQQQWYFSPIQQQFGSIPTIYVLNNKRKGVNIKNDPVNFEITRQGTITFEDGILFDKFNGLTIYDVTGVDTEYYQKSLAEVIQVYHVVLDVKESLDDLKVVYQEKKQKQPIFDGLFKQQTGSSNMFGNNKLPGIPPGLIKPSINLFSNK